MANLHRWGLRLLAAGGLGLLLWLAFLWPRTAGLLTLDQTRQGWTFPSTLYSDWLTLEPDRPIPLNQIERYLKKAGYVPLTPETPASPPKLNPGFFTQDRNSITLHARAFFDPGHANTVSARFIRITGFPEAIDQVEVSPDGERWARAATVQLEPIPIARFYDRSFESREFIRPERIPLKLRQAVVAVEDRRFFKHRGMDFRAMGRAAFEDFWHGRIVEGGSTITQQLAKNLFLTRRRTFSRKILDIFTAALIELRYSKDEILGLYLNQVYLGQDGSVSISGVEAASRYYFAKSAAALDLPECTLLAGLIRSPTLYSPVTHPEACRKRRDFVLEKMREEGFISPQETDAAKAQPPVLTISRNRPDSKGLYFADHIRNLLLNHYSERALTSQGLRILSTLDPFLQETAEHVLKNSPHEIALIAMEPATGCVRALVGGRHHDKSQFNRATQAKRQPGSTFKPFVYAAALKQGKSWMLASLLDDSPLTLSVPGQDAPWTPRNFDKKFRGRVTLAQVLMHSINVPTIRLTQSVTPEAAAALAHRMGIESEIHKVLSIGLGTSEATLLELSSAYVPLAAGGVRARPIFVKSVLDHEGKILEESAPEHEQVLDPQTTYLVTWALNQAMIQGTAQAAMTLGVTGGFAGKTGTTDEGRDAWFIGYSSDIVCGVWVGDDKPQSSGLTGPTDALPLWMAFIKASGLNRHAVPFEVPPGIVFKKVDENSGLLARSGCPQVATMPFHPETAPTLYCREHPGGVIGLLRRWFRETPQPTFR